MTNEQLFDLLSFDENIADVEIIQDEAIKYNATFVEANLILENGDTMVVPFVYYEGNDWIFTPCDWQGRLPKSAEEIDSINWRVNDTDTEAIMYDGLPMLAPWEKEIKDERRDRRKHLGAALKTAREKAGLSLRDVAERSGVSRNIICRTEGGRANTGIDAVGAIAAVYGMELGLLES